MFVVKRNRATFLLIFLICFVYQFLFLLLFYLILFGVYYFIASSYFFLLYFFTSVCSSSFNPLYALYSYPLPIFFLLPILHPPYRLFYPSAPHSALRTFMVVPHYGQPFIIYPVGVEKTGYDAG